jgi:hypothetical protein
MLAWDREAVKHIFNPYFDKGKLLTCVLLRICVVISLLFIAFKLLQFGLVDIIYIS